MITGEQYAKMIISAANNLNNNKELLNEMNVFPVPDGDTGKNMSMSIAGAKTAAEDALKGGETNIGTVAEKVAMETLRGARGNSGVILSQLLRGMAKEIKGKKYVTGTLFARCFSAASVTAYSAVMKPTEGTILTVARESAEAIVKFATTDKECIAIMREAVRAANISLEHTPELLPKLKQAGVVDAGGKGWVIVLEGMLYFLEKGKVIELYEGPAKEKAQSNLVNEMEEITFTYCTEFLVDKKSPEVNVEQFKKTISKIGDCMVVIEDFDVVKVHVHTDNPGIIIQNALKMGSLNDIKIDNMRYQHSEKIIKAEQQAVREPKKEYAIVSVSAGEGYSAIMSQLGVDGIIEGGQTMNPSAGDILEAINKVNAKTVYVLPNNKNIIMAAEAAKDMSDANVFVIQTKSVPEGIAALIAFDEESKAEDNAETMAQAAKAVSTGLVTYAVRDSLNDGVKKDDIIGLSKNGIVESGKNINEVAFEVCRNLIGDESALVTIYYGAEVKESDAKKLAEKVEKEYKEVEVSVQNGGQPIYYYNIAVE